VKVRRTSLVVCRDFFVYVLRYTGSLSGGEVLCCVVSTAATFLWKQQLKTSNQGPSRQEELRAKRNVNISVGRTLRLRTHLQRVGLGTCSKSGTP
jgi:hypothetical protein